MRTVTSIDLAAGQARAASDPRLRSNHNLHPSLDDPIQRFFNFMEVGTYVRPHRHSDPQRWEVFVALSGSALIVTFDEEGHVRDSARLSPTGPAVAVEIDAGEWHTVAATESSTVLFELKPGPYLPIANKDHASWAPAPGSPQCEPFLSFLLHAKAGDHWQLPHP